MAWSTEHVKAAYECNKELLKFYREQRGWTQAKLASVAGYSERLISKAEAGRSVSSDTVADLAEALSTSDCPIFPEDLISDPLQFARIYIQSLYRFREKMFEHVRPFLAEDVIFRVAGDPARIPFAGEYHGAEGVQLLMQRFFAIMEVPPNYDPMPYYRFVGQGNNVVIWGETWMHPFGRPLKTPMPITLLMRFRRGKLYRFEDRFDTEMGGRVLQEILENEASSRDTLSF